MTHSDMITDPSLLSVLAAAQSARDQSLAILDLLDAHPASPSAPTSPLTNNRELALKLAQQQEALYAHLSRVRRLNRAAINDVRYTKEATAEARSEVDQLHLHLQNLLYEQRHLHGEIVACEEYDHKYQQLPLIPVEDFLEQRPELHDADESALMEARINHEHAERQALEEKRQGLLKKKQGLIADNNKRKDDLANLDKDLEKFIEAADPIVKTFEKEY